MIYTAKCERCSFKTEVKTRKEIRLMPNACPQCGDGKYYYPIWADAQKAKFDRDVKIMDYIIKANLHKRSNNGAILNRLLKTLPSDENWFYTHRVARYLKKKPMSSNYIGWLFKRYKRGELYD